MKTTVQQAGRLGGLATGPTKRRSKNHYKNMARISAEVRRKKAGKKKLDKRKR